MKSYHCRNPINFSPNSIPYKWISIYIQYIRIDNDLDISIGEKSINTENVTCARLWLDGLTTKQWLFRWVKIFASHEARSAVFIGRGDFCLSFYSSSSRGPGHWPSGRSRAKVGHTLRTVCPLGHRDYEWALLPRISMARNLKSKAEMLRKFITHLYFQICPCEYNTLALAWCEFRK